MTKTLERIDDYELIAKHCYSMWTGKDVERWFNYAWEKGCHPVVRLSTLKELKAFQKVPNEPFREAYTNQVKHKEDQEDVAKRVVEFLQEREMVEKVDYKSKRFSGRGTECLKEHLGLQLRDGYGPSSLAIWIPTEIAEALCYALRLDPRRMGI